MYKTKYKKIENGKYTSNNSFYLKNYSSLWKDLAKCNPALAIRFLYLCSYADCDGYLKFGGIKRGINTLFMSTKDFKEVFSISTGMTTKIKNELFDNKLVIQTDDDKLIVNKKYYTRKYSLTMKMENPIRCSDSGIRDIYKTTRLKEHKRLGIIILLLEYLNISSNVICKNIEEKNLDNIIPLNMNEICDIVKYDYTHFSKVKQCLSNAKTKNNPLLMLMTHNSSSLFIVNNAVFYRGKDDLSNGRNSLEYRQFVRRVLDRDNCSCVICNSNMNLEVHHIKPYAKFKDLRTDVHNGITLCELHHSSMVLGGFHQTYGTRNNTTEQLQEYIDNKRKELGLPRITIEEIINS